MDRCRSMPAARSHRRHVTLAPPPRRGVALILVLGVMIVAAVLGAAAIRRNATTEIQFFTHAEVAIEMPYARASTSTGKREIFGQIRSLSLPQQHCRIWLSRPFC